MKLNPLILTTVFILGGAGMAHADVSNPNPLGNDYQALPMQNDTGATDANSRIQSLEARIASLETQMNKLFHGMAVDRETSHSRAIPYDEKAIQAMNAWSSEDHLNKAQEKVVYSGELQAKIQRLQERIDRFSQKPYLDTKGFKRAGLKRLLGNFQQELQEETAKLAWHKIQAKQTRVSQSQDQQAS